LKKKLTMDYINCSSILIVDYWPGEQKNIALDNWDISTWTENKISVQQNLSTINFEPHSFKLLLIRITSSHHISSSSTNTHSKPTKHQLALSQKTTISGHYPNMVRFLSSMALGPIALASMVLPSMALPTPTSATELTPSPTNHTQWLATPISKSPQFSAMAEAKSPPVAPGDDIHVVYPWDQSTRELPCVQLRQFPPLPEERFYSMEQRDGKTWGQFCILGLSVFTNSSFKMDGKVMIPTFEIDTASDESLLWHFPKRNGRYISIPTPIQPILAGKRNWIQSFSRNANGTTNSSRRFQNGSSTLVISGSTMRFRSKRNLAATPRYLLGCPRQPMSPVPPLVLKCLMLISIWCSTICWKLLVNTAWSCTRSQSLRPLSFALENPSRSWTPKPGKSTALQTPHWTGAPQSLPRVSNSASHRLTTHGLAGYKPSMKVIDPLRIGRIHLPRITSLNTSSSSTMSCFGKALWIPPHLTLLWHTLLGVPILRVRETSSVILELRDLRKLQNTSHSTRLPGIERSPGCNDWFLDRKLK